MRNSSRQEGLPYILKLLLAATIFIFAQQANAASVTYDFNKITNNNPGVDISDQLSITIWDADMANSQFMLTGTDALTSDQILFTVENDVGISSNVTEVYFDNDGNFFVGSSSVLNSLGGTTEFSGGGASPRNLPKGNDVGFTATNVLSVDTGNSSDGVNTSDDILGIILNLAPNTDFDDVVAAVASGDLRFGLHVRSIGGSTGGSDSFVNAEVVPIPAAVWLLGTAIVGLVGFSRRPSSAS